MCEGDERSPLPHWATWLINLGAWAASLGARYERAVIAVSVPSRTHTAVLAACGVVHRSFLPQLDASSQNLQFNRAAKISSGTPVRLIPVSGDAVFTGIFQGAFQDCHGSRYRISGSSLPADRYRLEVLRWPDTAAELFGHHCTQSRLTAPSSVMELLPGPAADFYGFSTMSCTIVGATSSLEEESEALVAVSETDAALPLRSLFRPRRISDSLNPYRSLLLPGRSDPEDFRQQVLGRHPPVSILDGAATVCRWLGARMAPVTLAVVERTSPASYAAAEALFQVRSRSTDDLPLPEQLVSIPSGIEVLSWRHSENAP